jgi:RNA polymerase sigma factor (sigma-70 family)
MASTPEGFEGWYRSAHPRLVAALLVFSGSVEVATEAVDEACLRTLARWPRLASIEHIDAWTYRVAVNCAKRRLRRTALERRLLARTRVTEELPPPAGEAWEAVRRLPVRQRTAVVLRYVADLPEAEIAQVMNVSRGTVASTLADARRALGRALLDVEVPEEERYV